MGTNDDFRRFRPAQRPPPASHAWPKMVARSKSIRYVRQPPSTDPAPTTLKPEDTQCQFMAISMPRADDGAPNQSGMSFHGDVLTGRLRLQDALALQAARLRAHNTARWAGREGLDPVLKFHLRIE